MRGSRGLVAPRRGDGYLPPEDGKHGRLACVQRGIVHFLESLEEMLDAVEEGAEPRTAALEASGEPPVAIRIGGGPAAFQVEVGIDLLHVLESVGGLEGARGDDLALFRFFANKRAVLAFCQGLLEEFARFSDRSLQGGERGARVAGFPR
jgi:hypothetical protein